MSTKKYDISGWVTRYNTRCTDGKTILPGAFAHNDKTTVPMLWNHQHNDINNVLGHIELEHRPNEGVYGYGYFNDNELAHNVSNMVKNKDINRMSIYATDIKMNKQNYVSHGIIQEVSLVLAGANPGAYIDVILKHNDDTSEAIIYNDTEDVIIEHSDNIEDDSYDIQDNSDNVEDNIYEESDDIIEHNDEKEERMENNEPDVDMLIEEIDNLTPEQRIILLTVAQGVENGDMTAETVKDLVGYGDADGENEKEDKEDKKPSLDYKYDEKRKEKEMGEKIKHNVFEANNETDSTIMHGILHEIYTNGRNNINMEESIIQHAEELGIKDINKLFPAPTEEPTHKKIIRAKYDWVDTILSNVNKTPFSNVKTTYIKIDEPEARAKGYLKKGETKTDIKLKALNRVTTPTTAYAKMSLHRDDLLDLQENDSMNKTFEIKDILEEKLNEEIARAILLGDGRNDTDDDKINEQNIRPIIKDDEMYTIKYTVTDNKDFKSTNTNDSLYKGMIRASIKARKDYMGSGSATLFTSEEHLAELLLLEDMNGRAIYETMDRLCSAFRVSNIVTIPNFNNGEAAKNLLGVIVNMKDYTLGDPGIRNGRQTYFEGFNIDKNINQFLFEKRHSGALSTPKSAIALYKVAG